MQDQTLPARPQNLIVAGFGLGQIAAFASSFSLTGVLADAIASDLRLSAAAVFGMASLPLAVAAFNGPTVARRVERRGGKATLLESHVVFAIGLLLVGVAHDGPSFAAGMLAIGLGMAYGLAPTPFAILVSLYGDAARRPITGVALIAALGFTFGWSLTAWFAEWRGWRGACFLWAAVQLSCWLLTAWVCPRTPGNGPMSPARLRCSALRPSDLSARPALVFAMTLGLVPAGQATREPTVR